MIKKKIVVDIILVHPVCVCVWVCLCLHKHKQITILKKFCSSLQQNCSCKITIKIFLTRYKHMSDIFSVQFVLIFGHDKH
jgi:hypothetical protein